MLPFVQAYTRWPGGELSFALILALLGATFTGKFKLISEDLGGRCKVHPLIVRPTLPIPSQCHQQ
jgi:hypothetical protein